MPLVSERLPHNSMPVTFALKGEEELSRQGWFYKEEGIFEEHITVVAHHGSRTPVPNGSREYAVSEVLSWRPEDATE